MECHIYFVLLGKPSHLKLLYIYRRSGQLNMFFGFIDLYVNGL